MIEKRKFNITLVTPDIKDEYHLLGVYDQENDIISYKESSSLLTEVTLDLKNKTLTRENKDYYLQYKLLENEETENEIRIKELNNSIVIRIRTEKFDIKLNKVEICYLVLDSNEKFNYEITF